MHALSPALDEFQSDLGLVKEAMRASVTPAYARRKNAHWQLWIQFCVSINIDPYLKFIDDPVPYIQVFGQRYRDGRIAPRGEPVGAGTVSDAMRSVGQELARVGSPDPRKTTQGDQDYRISSQLRGYRKTDAPPVRVKPAPISLVIAALVFAHQECPTPERKAVANMMCIAFFFCLRPGEYTGTTTDDQAFALEDVAVFLGARRLNNALSSDAEIEAATAVHLVFTTQKNGDKNEAVAHARSNDPLCCPVTSVTRQLLLHRQEFRRRGVPYDGKVKLATYYNDRQVRVPVKAAMMTDAIRWHAGVLEPVTGIKASSLSARSLRAGGAMALLAGGCDTNVIKLLARWRSDSMLRYLHQQSLPIFKKLAVTMFNQGQYTFLPEDWVPATA